MKHIIIFGFISSVFAGGCTSDHTPALTRDVGADGNVASDLNSFFNTDDSNRLTDSNLDDEDTQNIVPPSFQEIQDSVFTPYCGQRNCHGAEGATGSPDLREGFSYEAIVGKPSRRLPTMNYVDPGKSSSSFIFKKLRDGQGGACIDAGMAESGCGGPMPPSFSGLTLPKSAIDSVMVWIDSGAL